jgi:zinc protease
MLPDLHAFELGNGFRAILVQRRNLPVVASSVWYTVGSRDERTGETGLSHFLEHMMFKGTDRYAKGQIDLLTSKMGGSNNAFTSNDTTSYYFALGSDRWETALEIEASRMLGCALDAAEFAAEKSVVLEELAMGEDDPWNVLYQTLEALTYQVHSYHHPVIGWREELERLEVDAMRAYYERHYGPNRAFLVAVGDFDVARTEARVRELFAPLPPRAVPRAKVAAEPPQRGERRAVQQYPSGEDIVRIGMSFRTCRMGEDDDFTADVATHVLGAPKTGRLYKRLVQEARVATQVSVMNEARLDPGMLVIAVELVPGKDPARAEKLVREELDRIADGGATATELKQARTQLRSAHLFEEETVLDVAMRIGRFDAVAERGRALLADIPERYDRVTGKDVASLAARCFGAARANVVTLVPDRGPTPTRNGKKRAR